MVCIFRKYVNAWFRRQVKKDYFSTIKNIVLFTFKTIVLSGQINKRKAFLFVFFSLGEKCAHRPPTVVIFDIHSSRFFFVAKVSLLAIPKQKIDKRRKKRKKNFFVISFNFIFFLLISDSFSVVHFNNCVLCAALSLASLDRVYGGNQASLGKMWTIFHLKTLFIVSYLNFKSLDIYLLYCYWLFFLLSCIHSCHFPRQNVFAVHFMGWSHSHPTAVYKQKIAMQI